MTPKPRFTDPFHEEQRKRMQESRGFSQNQQDLVDFLKSGGQVAVKGLEIKVVKEFTAQKDTSISLYQFRVQRNTLFSLQRRGLLTCEHKDGWDYYTLKGSA